MMAEQWLTPKFTKNQVVRISLHDHQGKVKNDLARKALAYFAQTAEVLSTAPADMGGNVVLVYKLRAGDGAILELTEDCLMPVNDRT